MTNQKTIFFTFILFNKDISLNIQEELMKASTDVKHTRWEETFQIIYVSLSFYFIKEIGLLLDTSNSFFIFTKTFMIKQEFPSNWQFFPDFRDHNHFIDIENCE